jgi:hypothetical protein
MPVIIDGTNGVSTPNTFAFKNRIIDGGFTINQRGYVSGTSLSSGSYGHDRWKGGASGGTYTFTQGSTGVNTTITITAGSIIQVIEGANLPEGGTYVLSWTGTAQGKIGSGSFGASGITGTITAGTNTNIEFNTGTCGNVQLEVGSTATSFDYRPYGTELALCQRYYFKLTPNTAGNAGDGGFGSSANFSNAAAYSGIIFPVTMRTAPTATTATLSNFVYLSNGAGYTPTAIDLGSSSPQRVEMLVNVSPGSITGGQSGWLRLSAAGFLQFSAEL